MCGACSLAPCACSYIAALAPGGRMSHLAPVALEAMSQPQPHRGPTDVSCPCPQCYSLRAATWEVP